VVLATLGVAIPTSVARSRCWLEPTSPRTPPRRPDAHKGDAGRVLIVGGRSGLTGAAVLSARGAHRMGAGLVEVATTDAPTAAHLPETMVTTLPAQPEARAEALRKRMQRADAVVLGPGLGRDDEGARIAETVLAGCEVPLVIDADALWHLATLGLMPAAGRAWVLTPHPLEMARLLGVETPAVNDDRIGSARKAAGLFNAWVVLKGPGTVLSDAGSSWVMPYMTAALAVGGSGDVLAGAIAARLAERNSEGAIMVRTRIASAVHAHGRAGEHTAARRGASRGALATEIADLLATALEPD
jgi:NAD(P)H-hydrate epimerase